MMIYFIIKVRPFTEASMNILELFHEVTLFFASIIIMSFSDLTPTYQWEPVDGDAIRLMKVPQQTVGTPEEA